MRDFDYLVPETVAEASGLLTKYGENCRLLAGGTALLLALRQRMVMPSHLISLARIPDLRGITFDVVQGLRIGAFTRHSEVAGSSHVIRHYPMLSDMAGRLANPQVRNQGTIGGNICYADPATDPPSCLMALDATVVLKNATGERVLSVAEFLIDYYTTGLKPDEILAEIRIPPPRFNLGYHARFHRTAAEHRPLVNVAIAMTREGDSVREVRLVIGASTTVPTRIIAAEAFLNGKTITPAVAREAAEIATNNIDPLSDIRGTADYRRHIAGVVTRRTLERVWESRAVERSAA